MAAACVIFCWASALRTAAEAVAAPIASAVRVIAARRVMPWRPLLNMVMLNSELDDGVRCLGAADPAPRRVPIIVQDRP